MQKNETSRKITLLNIPQPGTEDHVTQKIGRLINTSISSISILNEIRNLVFQIPISELENMTHKLAEKLLDIIIQTSSVSSSIEIEFFRKETLSLLVTLNFKFQITTSPEKLTKFFKLISNGTIDEMAESLTIIRHSCEIAGNLQTNNFFKQIASLSIDAGIKRMKSLLNNMNIINYSSFYPYFTLLTLISFCSRNLNNDQLTTERQTIFALMEEFIKKSIPDEINYSFLIPLLVLKSRTIYYIVVLNNEKTKMQLVFDSYISYIKRCPISFHTFHSELSNFIVSVLNQKKDICFDSLLKVLPDVLKSNIDDIDFYLLRQNMTFTFCETALKTQKLESNTLFVILKFLNDYLFVEKILCNQRISRYSRVLNEVIKKIEISEPNINYFIIIFTGINTFFKMIDIEIDKILKNEKSNINKEIKIEKNKSNNDLNNVLTTINFVQISFETLFKILEIIQVCQTCYDQMILKLDNSTREKFHKMDYNNVIELYVNSLYTFQKLRNLVEKCNFRYSFLIINSSILDNSKTYILNFEIKKYYERIRSIMQLLYQKFPSIFSKCNSILSFRIWKLFFTKFLNQRDDKNLLIIDASFMKTFFTDIILLLPFFYTLINFINQEIENSKYGCFLLQTATSIFKKVNENNSITRPEMSQSQIVKLLECVYKIIDTFKRNVFKVVNIVDTISLIIEILIFTAVFLQQKNEVEKILTNDFTTILISILSEQHQNGIEVFLHFIKFIDLNYPQLIENQRVIDCLVNALSYEPVKTLKVIHIIGKHNKKIYEDKTRNSIILDHVYENLPKVSSEDKAFLIKIIKKLGFKREICCKNNFSATRYNIENQVQVPIKQIISSNVNSILENFDNDNLWNILKSTLISYFNQSAIEEIPMSEIIKPEKETQKYKYDCVCLITQLISKNKMKTLGLLQTISISQEVLCYVICSILSYKRTIISNEDYLPFFSLISSKEKFVLFLNNFISICSFCFQNSFMYELKMAQMIISFVHSENIEIKTFIIFVMNIISKINVIQINEPFTNKKFHFNEISCLPEYIQDIIEAIKELISVEDKEKMKFLILNSIHNSPLICIIIYFELSFDILEDNVLEELVYQLIDEKIYSQGQRNNRILGILIRGFPNVYFNFTQKIDSFVSKLLSSYNNFDDKEKDSIKEIVYPLLLLDTENNDKYQVVLDDVLNSNHIQVIIQLFKENYKNLNKVYQKQFYQILKSKLSNDGITEIKDWSELNENAIIQNGNWSKIRHYWLLFYYIDKNKATSLIISQLLYLLKRDTFSEIFIIINKQIANKEVIKYLISIDKYEYTMNIIFSYFDKNIRFINDEDFLYIGNCLQYGLKSKFRYLKDCLSDTSKSLCIYKALLLEKTNQLRIKLFENIPYVQNLLTFDDKPTQLNLIIASVAISYKDIIFNQKFKLYDLVMKVIISSFIYDGEYMLYNQKFIDFVYENRQMIYKNDLISFISKIIKLKSYYYLFLINKIIDNLSSLEELTLKDLQEMIDFNDLESSIFAIQKVIIPFLKRNRDQIDDFIEFVSVNHMYLINTILLLQDSLQYKVKSSKTLILYSKCKNDDQRYIVFEIWSKSENDGEFENMFKLFLGSLTIFVSIHQKNACENIKFPRDRNIIMSSLNLIIKSILNNQKNQHILVLLWKILVSNVSSIPNPLSTIWQLFLRQTLNLKSFAKKTQIDYLDSLITELTTFVCSPSPPENKEHYSILYFAHFLIFAFRMVLEQSNCAVKYISPIIRSGIYLTNCYGSQVHFLQMIFQVILELHLKASISQQQSANGSNNNSSFDVFDYLLTFIPSLIRAAIETSDDTVDYVTIVNTLCGVICNSRLVNWPYAFQGLYYLLENNKCHEEFFNNVKSLPYDNGLHKENEEIISIRFFPLMWIFCNSNEVRLKRYLPFALKLIQGGNSDISCKQILIDITLQTIISFPYDIAIAPIIKELVTTKSFRFLFMKHFLTLETISEQGAKSLIQIIKKSSLTNEVLKSNEIHSNKIRKILQDEANCKNKVLKVFGKHFISDEYKSLSKWELSSSLPEFIRYDFLDPNKSNMKQSLIYLHHSLYEHSLESGIKNIDSVDLDFLNSLSLDHKIYDPSLFSKTPEELKEIMVECFNNLPLNPLTIYSEQFAKYHFLSTIFKFMKPQKKPDKSITISPISSQYPTFIHTSFFNFRKKIFQSYQNYNINNNEELHKKEYRKSMEFSFTQPRALSAITSIDDIVDNIEKNFQNYKAILIALNSNNWIDILVNVISNGLKLKPNNDLFMISLYFISKNASKEVIQLLEKNEYTQFNIFWSSQFANLIKLDNSLKFLIPYLCKSVLISFLDSKDLLPFGSASNLNELSSFIDCVIQSDICQIIKKNNEIEEMYYKEIITGKENEVEIIEVESSSMLNSVYSFHNSIVPLSENETIYSIEPIINSYQNKVVLFNVLSTYGKITRFMLSPKSPIETNFAFLYKLLTNRLYNFNDTRERGQKLPIIPTLSLKDGFYIYKDDFLPFSSLNKKDKAIERINNIQFKKHYIKFHCLFAECYGTLCSVQLMLKGNVFNPLNMNINFDNAMVSVSSIDSIQNDQVIFRLFGRISHFMNESTLFGNFKNAIFSSFLCFSYYKKEILYTLKELEQPTEIINEQINNFSIANMDLATVSKSIDRLIQFSLTAQEKYTIPWL